MTSIMSTPLAGGFIAAIMGAGATALPGQEQKVLDLLARNAVPPTSDEERIDRAVEQWRALAARWHRSTRTTCASESSASCSGQEHRRREQPAARGGLVTRQDRRSRTDHRADLVIHGTEDPIIPYAHGEATANAIPAPGCSDRGHGTRAASANNPDPRHPRSSITPPEPIGP